MNCFEVGPEFGEVWSSVDTADCTSFLGTSETSTDQIQAFQDLPSFWAWNHLHQ